ncbi:MAG: hypothetical protein Q8P73_03635 [bacterium]|nr:hypothetical protein [bacterium]
MIIEQGYNYDKVSKVFGYFILSMKVLINRFLGTIFPPWLHFPIQLLIIAVGIMA